MVNGGGAWVDGEWLVATWQVSLYYRGNMSLTCVAIGQLGK